MNFSPTSPRHITAPLLFCLAVVLLCGAACRRVVPTQFYSPYDEATLASGAVSVGDLAALRQALDDRATHHEQLWVKSDVTITRRGVSGRDFFTALVLYQEPDQFRLRGSRVPIGTIFDVLLSGDQATLHFPREGNMFVGSLDDLAEKANAIGGLTPRDLVAAAMVQHNLAAWLNNPSSAVVWMNRGDHLLVSSRHPGSGRQFIWMVRKSDGLVREMLVRSRSGVEELRIEFLRYQLLPVGDGPPEPFPTDLQFFVPAQGIEVSSAGSEFKIRPGLSERAFAQPNAREVYPLRSLQFEEAP